jgi:short-subunit dehydrogenase involved in D-alanine esterification of teichoic acids
MPTHTKPPILLVPIKLPGGPMELTNNTVLITGGASGIGFALARALVDFNNTVLICGRDPEKLAMARSEIPELITFRCDITNSHDLSELQAELSSCYPKLNMLINNAGIQQYLDFTTLDIDEKKITQEIEINLTAQIKLINQLLPQLTSQENSAIIFLGSALGKVAKHSAPVYSATKAAIHSFAKSIRHQLANTNTKVFEVIPDLVQTNMTRDRVYEKKMQPDTLAHSVLEGIKKNYETILVGRTQLLFNLHRFLPGIANKIINK